MNNESDFNNEKKGERKKLLNIVASRKQKKNQREKSIDSIEMKMIFPLNKSDLFERKEGASQERRIFFYWQSNKITAQSTTAQRFPVYYRNVQCLYWIFVLWFFHLQLRQFPFVRRKSFSSMTLGDGTHWWESVGKFENVNGEVEEPKSAMTWYETVLILSI